MALLGLWSQWQALGLPTQPIWELTVPTKATFSYRLGTVGPLFPYPHLHHCEQRPLLCSCPVLPGHRTASSESALTRFCPENPSL